MGLFKKKEKKEEIRRGSQTIPELPELPKLPELPPMHHSNEDDEQLPQLPTFPNNSLGNKFSQNTIKEAVAGKEEDEEVEAEDFPEEYKGMMQKPLKKSFSKEYEDYEESITSNSEKRFSQEYEDGEEEMMEVHQKYEKSLLPQNITKQSPKIKEPEKYAVKTYMTRKSEPVFIRIDKFEESMKIFQDIKTQVLEIERLIKNTKEIKAKEEEELASWQTEIQNVKNQIEKVNQEIFSRVE